jgi:hypothetical protein
MASMVLPWVRRLTAGKVNQAGPNGYQTSLSRSALETACDLEWT